MTTSSAAASRVGLLGHVQRVFPGLQRPVEGLRVPGLLWKFRVIWATAIHLGLVAVAYYLAFWLRFDGAIPTEQLSSYRGLLVPLLSIHAVAFLALGLHRTSWRYVSIWELRHLVATITIGASGFYVYVHGWLTVTNYPRSVFIVGAILSVMMLGGLRLVRRALSEMSLPKNGTRVLIIGAGNAGEMISRDLRKKGHRPIGFVDDDERKVGQSIHGVKVLGTRAHLPRIVVSERPDEVLIAMPSVGPATIRQFIKSLEQFKVPITTLPPPREIVDGKVNLSQVRRFQVQDLLPRLPVELDTEGARRLVEGRRVLVTGAGGSIGSELCRQVARLDPDRLVLYERYENNLYGVLNTLNRSFRTTAALGDVTDRRRLHSVMREYRPDVIFHAAAHKHVPLMELNPCEAVKNNVIGTRMVAEAAAQFDVERFILISTDKAVNPSSLMGATKRTAELVIQSMAFHSEPRWATVRFGNVLGSNGSVVPRWLEQIAAGGPVTVTHPDVRRYFMLIPEAVELILQAAAMTRGREIFALEMGEQINLMAMAREVIRLSGFIPDEEIAIEVVGLRPGEKLSEELVGPDEQMLCSPIDKILHLTPVAPPDPEELMARVSLLGSMAQRGHASEVVELLRSIVPTFQPGEDVARISRAHGSYSPAPKVRHGRARVPHRQDHGVGLAPVPDPLAPDKAADSGHHLFAGNGNGHGTGNGYGNGNGNGNGNSHSHGNGNGQSTGHEPAETGSTAAWKGDLTPRDAADRQDHPVGPSAIDRPLDAVADSGVQTRSTPRGQPRGKARKVPAEIGAGLPPSERIR